MKKLSVLLVAAAVALSASAGVTKFVKSDVNAKDAKAKAELRQTNKFNRGGETIVQGKSVSAMDWSVRPASHVLKDGTNLLWDFETQAQADEWTMWDNDGDGFGWMYMNMTGVETGRWTPYSGEGLMSSASYDNDTQMPLYPDNWLISPVVTLNKTLSFYAAGQDASYAAEKFSVYVCVGNPTSVEDFVQVGVERTATGNYTKYQYDLSDYVGQEGCIAIRHYNVSDMFWLNIDDVAINDDELEPEPEVPTFITDLPEGCVVKEYWRNSACIYNSIFGIGQQATDGKFQVAFDEANGEAYVQNISWWHDSYDTWVKGTYDAATGMIIIPTGQFLYYYDGYGYGIQMGMGMTYVYEDEGETYMGYEIDDRTTEIQMMVDGENIYLLGTEGDVNAEFPFNYNATGLMTYYNDDLSMTALEFCNLDAEGNQMPFGVNFELAPAVPAKPTADEWYDCGDESGFSRFYFTLPNADVDGKMIDPSLLSYSIFVDNGNGPEIFHFTGDDYTYDLNYDEDITEVNYDLYSNAVDFNRGYVYMYRTNAEGFEPLFTENIGIQVYYTVDGVKNASEIAWLYDTPEPEDPHMTGYWLVEVDAQGNEIFTELKPGTNGDYVNLTEATYPTFYDVDNFYFMINGVAYGAGEAETAAFLGDADMNPLTEGNNTYYVEVGYTYVIGIHFIYDINTGDLVGYSAYVAKGGPVDVNEVSEGKTVASERYFNVAGQEMAQPNGLTIKVITYTDGTTNTVKVVK